MDALLWLEAVFATYINGILFWVVLFFLSWNAYILIFNKGVPNIRTSPSMRAAIIKLLQQEKPKSVVELGSGNGKMSRYLARALPQSDILGYEIAHKSYLWSNMLRRFLRLSNLSYRRADFFKENLGNVDAVAFFLSAYEMEKLGQKLHQELKPDALVISNRFQLGDGWQAAEVIEVSSMGVLEKFLHPFQGKLYVYRV